MDELYQAFDLFVLPSIYEGLGMVLIEGQVAGLPCIVSSEVPKIAKVTDNLEFIDLKTSPKIWASQIIYEYENNINRKDYVNEVSQEGYDIKLEVEKLEEKYLSFYKEV